jgi:hypothetical protein
LLLSLQTKPLILSPLEKKIKILNLKQNNEIINNINNKSVDNLSNKLIKSGDNLKTAPFIGAEWNFIEFIKTINPFNSNLAKSKNIMFNFNKKNSYNIFKNEKNIGIILEAALFASLDSLISKAYFSVKPNSILINLFFYWKPYVSLEMMNLIWIRWFDIEIYEDKESRIRRKWGKVYKHIYKRLVKSRGLWTFWAKKKLNILTRILNKVFKKRVNLKLTRLFYTYFDGNILVSLLGALSWSYKLKWVARHMWKTIIYNIRRGRINRFQDRLIPSSIRGTHIRLAGRFSKVNRKSRVRTIKWHFGTLARSVNNLKVINGFNSKNKAGVFNINIYSNAIVFK